MQLILSPQFAYWNERKPLAKALKAICAVASVEAAAAELGRFEAGPFGERHAVVVATWRRRWVEVISFFAFSPEVRKILYITTARSARRFATREISPATRRRRS